MFEVYTIKRVTGTKASLAKHFGILHSTLRQRLSKWLVVEDDSDLKFIGTNVYIVE